MGDGACLGICFTDHELLFAVSHPGKEREIRHTGCYEFSFHVRHVLTAGDSGLFDLIATSVRRIRDRFPAAEARILTPAPEECWTILPRSVYENAAERESHIRMLMEGVPRADLSVSWDSVSNSDYKLLTIRQNTSFTPFEKLLKDFSLTEFFSEYELGTKWQDSTGENGSFLHIHCQTRYLSVSSHILGKLRGVAIIPYQAPEDLTYLWKLHASRLPWMKGIHEKIYLHGPEASLVSTLLHTQWEDAGDTILMNSFDAMKITAPEKTVGFKLESAFPAVLLSIA